MLIGWLPRTITRLIGGVKSVLFFASDDDSNWPKYQNPDGLKHVEAAFTGHVIAKIKVGTPKITRQQSIINYRQASRLSQKCHAFRIFLSLICWVDDDFLPRNPLLGKSIKDLLGGSLSKSKLSWKFLWLPWQTSGDHFVCLCQLASTRPMWAKRKPENATWNPLGIHHHDVNRVLIWWWTEYDQFIWAVYP